MSHVQEETIEGYFYFRARIKVLEKDASKNPLIVIFKGSESHGKNWSSDCELLEEILVELLVSYTVPVRSYILKVKVGSNEVWSKEDCPFRSDRKVHLHSLPTVILWNSLAATNITLNGKSECTFENIHNLFLPNVPIAYSESQANNNAIENTKTFPNIDASGTEEMENNFSKPQYLQPETFQEDTAKTANY